MLRDWIREYLGLAQMERSASTRERFIIDALGKLSGQLEPKPQAPSLRPPPPRPAYQDWDTVQLIALEQLTSDPKKEN